LLRPSRDQLFEIDRRLHAEHGTRSLGNKPDPLDELVFIQLSIRTRQGAYQGGYEALAEIVEGDWSHLLHLSEEDLVSTIAGGGMASIKIDRLRNQMARILDRFGTVTLEPLRQMSDEAAEEFLVGLPGVGPKAARCVMMYSLGRKVFPVDSHCRRIMDRVGYLPAGVDRKQAHDVLQDIVPPPIRASLHINLVHHGKSICLPGAPRCEICPIRDLCRTGRGRLRTG
jgi:endonuclease III